MHSRSCSELGVPRQHLGLYMFSLFCSSLNTQWNRALPALVAPLLCLQYTKHRSAHQPPLVPLFTWPLWPCALWQHSERTPCSGCHSDDLGGPQSDTHSSTGALAYTLRQRQAIDILLYVGWRGAGWGGESHCSELTAETRGKLERGWERERVCQGEWQKVGARVCLCVYACVHLSLGSETIPQSFCLSPSKGRVLIFFFFF